MANTIKLRRSAVQGAVPTTAQLELGELALNTYDGKLFLKRDDGLAQYIVEVGGNVGFEVKNQTGYTIPKGTVLKFAGTLGASGRLLAAPFLANGTDPSEYVIGIAEHAISNEADGFAIHHGKIFELNTSAFSQGDILYASSTVAGGLTATRPAAPNNKVTVAAVVHSNASTGILQIRVSIGSSLGNDELVEITSLANNNGLIYNSGSGRFENRIATGTGSVVLSNTPTLVTPILGAASATSIANGLGAVGTPSYTFTGDLNTGMFSPAADTVVVSTGGGERLRVDSSGNVGIGTTSPASVLDVNGNVTITDKIIHSGDTNTSIRFPAADTFTVETNGSERMRINSSGNVGIGTTTPIAKLHVEGGSVRSNVSFIVSGAGELKTAIAGAGVALNSTGQVTFETGGTPAERMRINSSGNVGIGTTNPLFPLHVNGEVRGTKFTSDAGSQSLAHNTDLAVLILTGNPGPQLYLVSMGVNASGGSGNTVALVIVGTNGSGGRNAAVTQIVNATGTDVAVTNVAGTSTVNVKQTSGITQLISYSITRLM